MELSRSSGKEHSPDHPLALLLLGPPRIFINGDPLHIERQKAIALLAYLAITGLKHHRDMLAEMFWPEVESTRARAALRRALASLTHAIPGEWWEIDRETLQFHDRSEVIYFDVRAFRNLLCQSPKHPNPGTDLCKDCLDALTAAVQLYQADFLEGFTLSDCPEFDSWQRHQSDELCLELIGALKQLIRCHAEREENEIAIRYGKRWTRIDPLDEAARLALMQLYMQANQRNAAIREYEEYARLLGAELGVSPWGESKQLYESIKATSRTALPGSLETLNHVRGEKAEQTRKVRSRTKSKHIRMVGRESEMEQAEAKWRRVLQGDTVVLVVSGEPGIGKSYLIRELKKKVTEQGGQALEGRCDPDGGLPFACFGPLVLQGLNRLQAGGNLEDIPGYALADLARIAPEAITMFGNIPTNPRLDPQSEQIRSFNSFVVFCQTAMRVWQTPLLLILEDFHWADAGSLQLLRHLAYRARNDPLKLMIVVTLRDTEGDLETANGTQVLLTDLHQNGLSEPCPLHPLGIDQTRELMKEILIDKEEMVDRLVEAIHHKTEGNPYFIEELSRTLIEEGRLDEAFESDRLMEDMKIPSSIRDVILRRVKRLSTTAQNMLQQAAFLGQQFDLSLLFGLCNIDEELLIKALDEAEQAHLLHETNTPEGIRMAFAHTLIPLALRENLSGLRRRREHQRVAEFLAIHTPEDASALAYHYALADNRPKAIEYSQLAARKAIELNVYEDALKHLRVALNLLKNTTPSDTRLSILEDYGDVYRLIGEGSQAVAVYQEARDVWLHLPGRERWTGVRLQRKIGETVTNMNQFSEVQRLATISRASLEAGLALIINEAPHPEKVRLLAALSRNAWYMRSKIDWEAAEGYAIHAVEIAKALNQPLEISISLEALAAVYGLKGMLHERVELCQRRLNLSFDPRFTNLKERVNIYLQTGMAVYDVGKYLLALEYLREAESLGRQIGDIPKQADALVRQAQCLFRLDRWDDFLAIEHQIRSLQNRFTYKRMGVLTCFYYALQSAVYTWRGEFGLGEHLKTEAHQVMLTIGGSEQNWARNQHF